MERGHAANLGETNDAAREGCQRRYHRRRRLSTASNCVDKSGASHLTGLEKSPLNLREASHWPNPNSAPNGSVKTAAPNSLISTRIPSSAQNAERSSRERRRARARPRRRTRRIRSSRRRPELTWCRWTRSRPATKRRPRPRSTKSTSKTTASWKRRRKTTTTSATSSTATSLRTKKAEGGGARRAGGRFFLVAALPLRVYRRPRHFASASPSSGCKSTRIFGAIAQLGERFNGIEEVVGSIPSGSTNIK